MRLFLAVGGISKLYNFNTTGGTSARIISKTTESFLNYTGYTAGFFLGTGAVFLSLSSNGNQINFTSNLINNANVLYNITIVKRLGLTDTCVDIYINGMLTTINVTGFINTDFKSNTPINIGRFNNIFSGYYNGNIYDLKIFNKALTQEEVLKLYNLEIPPTAKNNLIFDMPFEQLNKVGSNVFTPELVAGNNGQLIGYPTGAKGIVDVNGNDIQLVP